MGRFSSSMVLVFALAILLRILQWSDLLDILAFFLEYLAGAAALLSGLIAVVFKKERSILVIASLVIPTGFLLYFLGLSLLN